jgi:hypothetical protein
MCSSILDFISAISDIQNRFFSQISEKLQYQISGLLIRQQAEGYRINPISGVEKWLLSSPMFCHPKCMRIYMLEGTYMYAKLHVCLLACIPVYTCIYKHACIRAFSHACMQASIKRIVYVYQGYVKLNCTLDTAKY